jgi:hypothetical protein
MNSTTIIENIATTHFIPAMVQSHARSKDPCYQSTLCPNSHPRTCEGMDFERGEETQRSQDLSALQVNDSTIDVSTNTICYLLSGVLPHLFASPIKNDAATSAPPPAFSEAGIAMHQKIRHFFQFTRQYTGLTTGETLHSIYLIDKLIQAEADQSHTGRPSIISESNLGTLLLVAVVLATKLSRDIPYRNSWWAKVFGIPLSILNQSEIVFLKKARYSLGMNADAYWNLYFTLLGGWNGNETELPGEECAPSDFSSGGMKKGMDIEQTD